MKNTFGWTSATMTKLLFLQVSLKWVPILRFEKWSPKALSFNGTFNNSIFTGNCHLLYTPSSSPNHHFASQEGKNKKVNKNEVRICINSQNILKWRVTWFHIRALLLLFYYTVIWLIFWMMAVNSDKHIAMLHYEQLLTCDLQCNIVHLGHSFHTNYILL